MGYFSAPHTGNYYQQQKEQKQRQEEEARRRKEEEQRAEFERLSQMDEKGLLIELLQTLKSCDRRLARLEEAVGSTNHNGDAILPGISSIKNTLKSIQSDVSSISTNTMSY